MHGQQYGLWGVDQASDPAALQRMQGELFAVYCGVCDTLMYARPKQVGSQLKCPDCGALTSVKAPPAPVEKKSVLVPEGEEYQLDPAAAGQPAPLPAYVERVQQAAHVAVELQARQRAAELPPMPALPTLQGVWPMLVREPVTTWWVGISVSGMGLAWLVIDSIPAPGASGLALIYSLFCRILATLAFVLWSGPTAAIWTAILAESSEGHRKLHVSPSPWFFNCLAETSYIGVALALSWIPGFALITFFPVEIWATMGGISALFVFPVLLLATLQEGSPLAVHSPRIWGSLLRRPFHWLVFYLESGVLAAATALTSAALVIQMESWAIYAAVPLVLAGLFVYFRILGRFAWWLAESLPPPAEDSTQPRYQRF
jgi:hypothetical protein